MSLFKQCKAIFLDCQPCYWLLSGAFSFHCHWDLIQTDFRNTHWKQHKAVWEADVGELPKAHLQLRWPSQLLPAGQLTPNSTQRQDHKRKLKLWNFCSESSHESFLKL